MELRQGGAGVKHERIVEIVREAGFGQAELSHYFPFLKRLPERPILHHSNINAVLLIPAYDLVPGSLCRQFQQFTIIFHFSAPSI